MRLTEPGNAGRATPDAAPVPAIARWLCVIAAAAALAIAAVYLAMPWLHYFGKPLATLLIAAMAWQLPSAERGYRNGILIGLMLSTLGDVFLMLPGDRFVPGLGSFLLAHLAYLFAFTRRARLFARPAPVLAYAMAATLFVFWLWPELPSALRAPVLVYVTLLAAMAAQAAVVWTQRRDRASALAAIGGVFFVASDSMLAIDRFVMPFAAETLAVLATYWIAQTLIACSIASRGA